MRTFNVALTSPTGERWMMGPMSAAKPEQFVVWAEENQLPAVMVMALTISILAEHPRPPAPGEVFEHHIDGWSMAIVGYVEDHPPARQVVDH